MKWLSATLIFCLELLTVLASSISECDTKYSIYFSYLVAVPGVLPYETIVSTTVQAYNSCLSA